MSQKDRDDLVIGDLVECRPLYNWVDRIFVGKGKGGGALTVKASDEKAYFNGEVYGTVYWGSYDWRFKKINKYIPYTWDDKLLGMTVYRDCDTYRAIIIQQTIDTVSYGLGSCNYTRLLELFTHEDGTPFGKLI